jgi:nicotinamidase-related amidase
MYDYTGEMAGDFDFKEGSDEVAFCPLLTRPLKAVEIVKTRYSAFVGTRLDEALHRLQVDTVIVCGFMTNFCCDSTARDAHDRDFFVDFVVDATGTPGTETMDQDNIRRIVSEFLGAGYARIYSTEDYLDTLQRAI